MKYVLNKDLPTFKAGTPATFNNGIFKSEDGKVIAHFSATDLATHPEILTEWFTPVEEKRKVVPDEGDKHYIINSYGDIDCMTSITCWQHQTLDQGNWRWTQEEAELEVKKRAAIERVRRYLCERNMLSTDHNEIYYLVRNNNGTIESEENKGYLYYSPYGRIKDVDTSDFIQDCYEDLQIIHGQ